MNNKAKHLILFYIGFCTYITVEVLFRGQSHWLMGIDGSICFMFFDKINDYISWDLDLFWQGSIGSAFVTFTELVIGLSLQYMNLPSIWDYSNEWLNYRGVICPLFSFAWIWLGVIAIILADCINYYLLWNGDRPRYKLFWFVRFELPKRKHFCS